jgi:hypothetical protein
MLSKQGYLSCKGPKGPVNAGRRMRFGMLRMAMNLPGLIVQYFKIQHLGSQGKVASALCARMPRIAIEAINDAGHR